MQKRRQISAVCLGLACAGKEQFSILAWCDAFPRQTFLNVILQDACQCLAVGRDCKCRRRQITLRKINRRNHNTHAVFRSSWEVPTYEFGNGKIWTLLAISYSFFPHLLTKTCLGLTQQNKEQRMCIRVPTHHMSENTANLLISMRMSHCKE